MQLSPILYVNPYTRELVCEQRSSFPADNERFREALKGQGVTQMGCWSLNDFANWGPWVISGWSFDRYSSRVPRWLRRAIEERKKLRARHA